MKKIAIGVLACTALSGCGDANLDWDNARISGGMVYSENENNPFSGHLTNAPGNVIIPENSPESELFSFPFIVLNIAKPQEAISLESLFCNIDVNDGLRDGEVICRDTKSTVRWKGEFDNGNADGKWEIYGTKGNIILSAEFSNGKLNGRLDGYHPNQEGKIISRSYKDGIKDGAEEIWAYNGNQILSTAWKDGKEHGFRREWWEHGTPKLDVHLENGEQSGLLTRYNAKGSIIRTVTPFKGGYARLTIYGGANDTPSIYDVDSSGKMYPADEE